MSGADGRARRFARAWDDLRGRSGRRVVDLVRGQVDVARAGAVLARSTASGAVGRSAARAQMAEVEHEGDAARAELVRVLRRVLATPIDREDLFRLSRSVDDVLDHLRDYVRETDLFGPEDLGFAVEPLQAVIDGLDELENAVLKMIDDPGSVTVAVLATRKSCSRVRQLYQTRLTELFAGPLEMDTLRRRELLSRLDAVGRRLGEAADALADAMLKRSH
ncbi:MULTISPECIES: DUF47 domain-containing protein [Streptosporangium]|uniref:Uncharacterized protein Yka (UPF0111/DUF47 family) n=1 Tax=Streptosporangium brasiliense TaxID=47480 RepID=A0ABT9RET6_9ACTN|nr:DUF47 family protein [Streptosporangium brasiliense]MDP9867792.1 uncharacterized protein Yka (UPF0111/DUF47 family) [Streptosporangium brasiliense]